MHKKLSILLVGAAVMTAAACGSDGSGGPGFADSVSTADAQDVAVNTGEYAGYVISSMDFNGPSIALAAPAMAAQLAASHPAMVSRYPGMTFRQPDLSMLDWRTALQRVKGPQYSAAEGCTYSGHGTYDIGGGTAVDVDQNGIPDDLLIRIECVMTDSTSAVDTVVTQTVVEEISIKQIFASLYGEAITYVIRQRLENDHGDFQEVNVDVRGTLDIRSGSVSDQASYKVRQAGSLTGVAQSVEYGQAYDNAFDPLSTITLGSDLPDGALTLTGRQYIIDNTDPDVTNALSFSIATPTALAYDASCAAVANNPPFTSGVLRGRLNNNADQASFTATFTACGVAPTIAIDGAFAAPAMATR